MSLLNLEQLVGGLGLFGGNNTAQTQSAQAQYGFGVNGNASIESSLGGLVTGLGSGIINAGMQGLQVVGGMFDQGLHMVDNIFHPGPVAVNPILPVNPNPPPPNGHHGGHHGGNCHGGNHGGNCNGSNGGHHNGGNNGGYYYGGNGGYYNGGNNGGYYNGGNGGYYYGGNNGSYYNGGNGGYYYGGNNGGYYYGGNYYVGTGNSCTPPASLL